MCQKCGGLGLNGFTFKKFKRKKGLINERKNPGGCLGFAC
jgi:hypothetical protein